LDLNRAMALERVAVLEGAVVLKRAVVLNRVTAYRVVILNRIKGSQNGRHLPERHTAVVRPYGQR